MRSYFTKIFCCIFFLLSHQLAFANDNREKCTYSYLDEDNWKLLAQNIRERMELRIKDFLDTRKIAFEGMYLPVKIFNQWEDYEPKYNNNYVSTSFSLWTDKGQNLCHADQPLEKCNLEPKYPLYFYYELIRDEQGIPLKEVCNISANINVAIVNITQQFKLGSIEIFNSNEIIHQWVIKDLNSSLED